MAERDCELDCPKCGQQMHCTPGKNGGRMKFNCDGSPGLPHRITVYWSDGLRVPKRKTPEVTGIRALVERAKRLAMRGREATQ